MSYLVRELSSPVASDQGVADIVGVWDALPVLINPEHLPQLNLNE